VKWDFSTEPVMRLKHDSGLSGEHRLQFVCEIGGQGTVLLKDLRKLKLTHTFKA